jgi:transcriptional regulator with XRE-family HTH domain
MTSTITAAVAANVRAHMQSAGIAQTTLAEQAGISRSGLIHKYHGRQPFTVENLVHIARALDLPVADLLVNTDKAVS